MNCDFDKTRDELIQERFIAPFADWCRRNGLRSRMQAYGRLWLGMDAKRIVDIPEAECWFFFGTPWTEDGVFNPVENKITSAAANDGGLGVAVSRGETPPSRNAGARTQEPGKR